MTVHAETASANEPPFIVGIVERLESKLSQLSDETRDIEIEISEHTAKLAQLAAQLEKKTRETNNVKSLLEQAQVMQIEQTEGALNAEKTTAATPPPDFAKRQREHVNSMSWQIRRQAYIILKDAGRPLGRAELLEGIIRSGIVLNAKNPRSAIGKTLWRADDEFEYRDNGYWIVGEPISQEIVRTKRFRSRKARN